MYSAKKAAVENTVRKEIASSFRNSFISGLYSGLNERYRINYGGTAR